MCSARRAPLSLVALGHVRTWYESVAVFDDVFSDCKSDIGPRRMEILQRSVRETKRKQTWTNTNSSTSRKFFGDNVPVFARTVKLSEVEWIWLGVGCDCRLHEKKFEGEVGSTSSRIFNNDTIETQTACWGIALKRCKWIEKAGLSEQSVGVCRWTESPARQSCRMTIWCRAL